MTTLAIFAFARGFRAGSVVTTDATFQHMLVPLTERGFRVQYCSPVAERAGFRGREVIHPSLSLNSLPGSENGLQHYITRFPLMVIALVSLFVRRRAEWDLVGIVDADVHCQIVFLLCRIFKIPAFLYLRDQPAARFLRHIRQGTLPVRCLATGAGTYLEWGSKYMTRRIPTIVTGGDLRRHYCQHAPRLFEFVSTLVKPEDVMSPRQARPDVAMTILTVGRVAPVKGIEYLLEALGQTRYNIPMRLRVVGPFVSDYYQMLLAIVDRLGIRALVEFCGPVPHGPALWAEFAAADIYVQPSLSEGTPKSLVEALAASLPCVVTDVGGMPDLVSHGDAGVIVPAADSRALAQALDLLAFDSQLRTQLSRVAAEKARTLTLDIQLDRLVAFLRESFPSTFGQVGKRRVENVSGGTNTS